MLISGEITPTSIASKPHIMKIVLSDYDFEKQSRGEILMNWTANTMVTLGNDGRPKDAKGDKD